VREGKYEHGKGTTDPVKHGSRRTPEPTARLGTDIEAKIGLQLRAMYCEVVSQGIPDRFAAILDRLDETASDEAEAARMSENEVSNGYTR
jgi:hypothetical protein